MPATPTPAMVHNTEEQMMYGTPAQKQEAGMELATPKVNAQEDLLNRSLDPASVDMWAQKVANEQATLSELPARGAQGAILRTAVLKRALEINPEYDPASAETHILNRRNLGAQMQYMGQLAAATSG